jgi:hypothetical protein
LPLLFNFALDYGIRRVQVNQNGLKVNGTDHFLFYADDVNILGGSVRTKKRSIETLIVASKETGLEEMPTRLNTWSCPEIRMQGDVTVLRLIIVPLKGWNSSNI